MINRPTWEEVRDDEPIYSPEQGDGEARWQRFIGRLKCFFGDHDWISTERNEDHIAGTGWWKECTRCRKWMRLR